MPTLILVKHAQPDILPHVAARRWRLSAKGRRQAFALADRLAAYLPFALIASPEPKARETAGIVASRLGLDMTIGPELYEHDRSNVPFLSQTAFLEAVAEFFARPEELVFGSETAHQARQRFTRAVEQIIAAHPDENIVIVAHGTVISLFVGHHTGIDPFPLWQRLGMSAFVVLSRPDFQLLAVEDG